MADIDLGARITGGHPLPDSGIDDEELTGGQPIDPEGLKLRLQAELLAAPVVEPEKPPKPPKPPKPKAKAKAA